MTVTALVSQCAASGASIVEITGGEPLLQEAFAELAGCLRDESGKPVLVETNGSRDISAIPEGVTGIVDFKCPGSGESHAMDMDNVGRLRPIDQVKFVVGDRADYEWAGDLVRRHDLPGRCRAVFFSPVFGVMDSRRLGDWIVGDGLPVRLQMALHKAVGMR
jgi:7-carboxy-7-deazaguanine synthase